jgi:hypothetical protein
MTRLPTPGQDDGTWGDILNAYLEVSLASDGTLKPNVVGTNQIQSGAVTNSQLDNSTKTSLAAANTAVQSVNSKTGSAVSLTASDVSAVATSAVGANNGVASLDSGGKLPTGQLPGTVVTGSAAATAAAQAPLASASGLNSIQWVAERINVQAFGAVPGTDCSTAVLAAIAASPVSDITLYFPAASSPYQIRLGQIGSSGAGNGKKLRIEGDGPTLSILAPVTTTDPLFTVSGNGDTSDDWFEMRDVGLTFTTDRLLANPLIALNYVRNIKIRVRADVSQRIGTLFLLESAYQAEFEGCDLRTGKWGVPIEFTNATNTPSLGTIAQCDTYRFTNTVITGCIGPIFRTAGKEIHGIACDGLKVVNTTFYPTNPSTETTLNGAHSAAATSLTVTSGTGIVTGDVLCVGMDGGGAGESMDVVKVASVSVNTITLDTNTPLRFAHPTGAAALVGGICFSAGDGIHGIKFDTTHWEGHQIGAGLGNVQSVTIINAYSAAGTFIRANGNTQKIRALGVNMTGTTAANTFLRRSTQNTINTDGDWIARGIYVPTGVSVSVTGFPHNTKNWAFELTNSAQINETWNAQTGQEGAKRFIGQVNGGQTYALTYGGQGTFADGVTTIDLGAVDAKTSAQIDALFKTTPANGTYATGTLSSNPVVLMRRNGKWNVSAGLTVIT